MTIPRSDPAFLDLSLSGIVMRRFQNYWLDPVTWESQEWAFLDFSWDRIPSDPVGSDLVTLGLLGYGDLRDLFALATTEGWMGRLRVYHVNDADDGPAPSVNQVLVSQVSGRVQIRELGVTSLSVSLGSALGTAGRQAGAVYATNSLVGVPCELS